jgi:putative copper export protein
MPTSSSNWLPWLTEESPTPPAGVRTAGRATVAHHGTQAFGLRPVPHRPLTPADLRTDFGPVPTSAPPDRHQRSRVGRVLRDLALVVAVGLAITGAWLVLVTLRSPDPRTAADQVGLHLDRSVAASLRADRVAAFGTWFVNVTTTFVLGGVLFRSFVSTAQTRALGWSPVRILRAAALVGIVASLAVVPFRAAALAGTDRVVVTDPATLEFVVTSRFGHAALLRVAGLLLAACAVVGGGCAAAAAEPQRCRSRGRAGWRPAEGSVLDRASGAAGALLLLASFAWVGHPQATASSPSGPGPLLVVGQLVHVLAVSTWFGGLVLLYLQIRAGRRAGAVRTSAEVVARFSTLAGVALALAAATGVVLARSQIASVEALTTTPYGKALVLKLALVSLVAAIGGGNKLFVVPRIVGLQGPAAWRALHRTLLTEATIIAAGVLLATTAMTSGGFPNLP